VKIAELSTTELRTKLRNDGIILETGPFTINLQTNLEILVEPLKSLYADSTIPQKQVISDFHIQLERAGGLRIWWRPQVLFRFQGRVPFNPFPLRLAFPLLEWGMNWCIANYANQFMLIHSAVLERDGTAILLIAPPGSGKSTLAAALSFRGWRLFSDELALVRPADGHLIPLPRPIGLKNESIEIIRKFAPEAYVSDIWPDSHKGAIAHVRPPQNCVDRCHESSVPSSILFISYSPDAEIRINPWSKSQAFLRVAESSFNYSLLGKIGFETMARLIDLCNCYEFIYSDLDDAVKKLSLL
jgi:HprK-related kinase A